MIVRIILRKLHTTSQCRLRALPQTMPRTIDDYRECLKAPPKHEGNLVRVAFIGDPNVGKSTIINKLMARDICAVSNKPHTTRDSSTVALTTDDLQMVLVDTPGSVHGVHARKHQLPKEMVLAPKKVLDKEIDVLVAVIDASDVYRRTHLTTEMLRLLHKHRTDQPAACSILVLNKIDRVGWKRELIDCVDSLCRGIVGNQKVVKIEAGGKVDLKQKIWEKEERRRMKLEGKETPQTTTEETNELETSPEAPDPGTYKAKYPPRLETWPHFERVFMVSALSGDGIDDVKQFVLSRAKKRVWQFRKEFLTQKDPVKFTEEIVKSKLLDHLSREIPYNLNPKVVGWYFDDSGTLHVNVNIDCTREREVRAILGREAKMLRKIVADTRQQMCDIFGGEIALKIAVENVKKKKK